MADVLAPVRAGFFERMRANTFAAGILARAPRIAIALVIALAPPALLFAALALGPEELRAVATDSSRVHDLFGRVIAGLITASTIAVSVAAFTLRGDMKDLARFREEQEAKEAFRGELRDLMDAERAPILLSELAAETLEAAARAAREASMAADGARGLTASGVTLEEYLHVVETRASLVAEKVRAAGTRPDKAHLAFLDMEHEVVLALARRFLRDEQLAGEARAKLDHLHELLRRVQVLLRYTKKMDLEHGLSRMSHAMLATTTPAVIVAAIFTLTYGSGAVDALGTMGAAALVCAGLAAILLPLGAFVSYLVRFVFVNQHTLAHDGFVLGPEEPDVAKRSERQRGQTPQVP